MHFRKINILNVKIGAVSGVTNSPTNSVSRSWAARANFTSSQLEVKSTNVYHFKHPFLIY